MTCITALLFSLLTITTGATGCKKDKANSGYEMRSINVTKSSLEMKTGETAQVQASAVPAVANPPAFQWTSADNTIAAVSNGLVTALKAGTTIITVKFGDIEKKIPVKVMAPVVDENLALLYHKQLNASVAAPELQLDGAGTYTADGLNVTTKGKLVKLDRFYAMAERKVQYRVKFSADAKVLFRSSQGDFGLTVDVPGKKISLATSPARVQNVSFLQANREYLLEIYHVYQDARVRMVDEQTGETAELLATHDGQGGVGQGALQAGFSVGMQWDHYCFSLTGGTSVLVRSIHVYALKKKVNLVMYGDSLSQPEGYFPTKDFSQAWTQQVITKMGGNAVSSGRGGAKIDMLLDFIKNELPFIEAKYVMVTIGTNGGNTEAKLTQLVEYIKSRGSIPILNNIPSNESGTQITENALIELVRRKMNISGSRLDNATSLLGDGKEVDKTTMYWEDYTGSYGWQIYHHPNEKGGKRMFEQIQADLPVIFQ